MSCCRGRRTSPASRWRPTPTSARTSGASCHPRPPSAAPTTSSPTRSMKRKSSTAYPSRERLPHRLRLQRQKGFARPTPRPEPASRREDRDRLTRHCSRCAKELSRREETGDGGLYKTDSDGG